MNTIDIDTGGTFTDGVFRHDGRVATVKVDTTPHDPVQCFMTCIEEGAAQLGMDGPGLLEATDVIRYATTAATNAIVQMQGPRIGLLVSEKAGKNLYQEENDGPAPVRKFLDESLIEEIPERVGGNGAVESAVDEESFRAATESLLDRGARILVVAFRNAHVNPANEIQARALCERMLPSFYLGRPFMLLSHQVSTSGSDAERLNSAVLSGYLHRQLVSYLYRCDDAVRRRGFRHPLLIVHSTGGLARVAKTKALNTYNSGPTAGVFGAARLARRYELPFVVTMDLGGTSTDVAFIVDGDQRLSFRAEIEGTAVSVPMIDVVGLGGGGGSIASIAGQGLRVGPESAGAVPGPACYDLGNNAPTVTDANAVLALTAPDNFLGGRRRINVDLARGAIGERIARPLKLSVEQGAQSIRSALADGLAAAIREEAARRSFPLRDAVLFAYGGAGPLHAADIATAVGIGTFYMFPESAVFSAAGSSTMDIQHFYEAPVRGAGGEDLPTTARKSAARLRDRAHRDIRGEGFDPAAAELGFELEDAQGKRRPLTWEELDDRDAANDAGGLLRLLAAIRMPGAADGGAPIRPRECGTNAAQREVEWPGGRIMTPVFAYGALEPGTGITGPALVETAETTCVIPDAWQAVIDRFGALKVFKT